MRGLAIDTALGACTAAVVEDGRVLAARSETMERGHQERLGGLVREILAEAGLEGDLPGRLDRILVTVGPGSFTGLRVGLAFAQGLGFALDRPVTGVSTLAALAASADGEGRVLAVIDARRDQVYFAAYDGQTETIPSEALGLAEARARLSDLREAGPVQLVGSGAALIGEPSDILVPTPEGLARLATRPVDVGPVRPLYLRAPDALPPGRKPGEARRR